MAAGTPTRLRGRDVCASALNLYTFLIVIAQILYFLPSLVSLVCFVSLLLKVRTSRQNVFMIIQLCDILYYVMYALYVMPSTDYDALVHLDAVATPLIVCVMALTVSYLHLHCTGGKFRVTHLFLLVPAVVVAAVLGLLYFLVGFDDAATLARLCDEGKRNALPEAVGTPLHQGYLFIEGPFLRCLCLLMILVVVGQCLVVLRRRGYRFGNVVRFLFKGGKSTPSAVIAVCYLVQVLTLLPLSVLGRQGMVTYVGAALVLTIILAVIKLVIYHVDVCGDNNNYCTLYSLTHVETQEVMPDEADVEEAPADEEQKSKTDVLAERFRVMMEEEKIYKEEGLTMAVLSERMGVGRTTLSQMINQKYGVPFRDLLNRYRIEAVKAYLMSDPTATQETLAYECGFKYASALNRKFKEAEGETPFSWIAKHTQD